MNNENNNSFNFKKLPWGWILLGITLWFLFPWIYSVLFDFIIRNPESYGTRFGAVGDIYGSLNTLISSLALCAVAYSTILQVNELKLARQTYIDQLNEAKYSNFSGLFYSLLQSKQQTFNNLKVEDINGRTYIGQTLFGVLSTDFVKFLDKNKHSQNDELKNLSIKDVQNYFSFELMREYKGSIYSELLTYFVNYSNILNLISKADIKETDKDFFIGLLRDGISIYEQVLIIAISSFDKNLKLSLKNSKLIKAPFGGTMLMFIKRFHGADIFANESLIAKLSKIENQTPT